MQHRSRHWSGPRLGGGGETARQRTASTPELAQRWLSHFSITVTSRADTYVVTLVGELDVAGAGSLRAALTRLTERDVVVDVSRLAFIDAAGVSVLVSARTRAERDGHMLAVRGAHGIVRRVVELLGLCHLLDDAASRERPRAAPLRHRAPR